jgi:hypothetical protein
MAIGLLNGVLITSGIIVLGLLMVSQRRISQSKTLLYTEYEAWEEREKTEPHRTQHDREI